MFMILIAQNYPVNFFLAEYIYPNDPFPIYLIISYFCIQIPN